MMRLFLINMYRYWRGNGSLWRLKMFVIKSLRRKGCLRPLRMLLSNRSSRRQGFLRTVRVFFINNWRRKRRLWALRIVFVNKPGRRKGHFRMSGMLLRNRSWRRKGWWWSSGVFIKLDSLSVYCWLASRWMRVGVVFPLNIAFPWLFLGHMIIAEIGHRARSRPSRGLFKLRRAWHGRRRRNVFKQTKQKEKEKPIKTEGSIFPKLSWKFDDSGARTQRNKNQEKKRVYFERRLVNLESPSLVPIRSSFPTDVTLNSLQNFA